MKKPISTIDFAELARLANEAGERAACEAFAAGVLAVDATSPGQTRKKSLFARVVFKSPGKKPDMKRQKDSPDLPKRKRAISRSS